MASSPNPIASEGSERRLTWIHLGRRSYRPVLELQMERWGHVRDGLCADTIFTVEHEPVITLGKRASESDVLLSEEALRERGVDLIRIDRGGEATYHGPGQLVIYPIIHTTRWGLGASDLVRGLSCVIQEWLASLSIEAKWDNEHPGLWVPPADPSNPFLGAAKITAVGMKIQSGVSRHGAAVNLTTSLDAWSLFVPCGMPGARSTSVQVELQDRAVPTMDEAAERIVEGFAKRFAFELNRETID